MKTRMMDGPNESGGRVENEGTYNGGLTTEQQAGLEPLPDEPETDNADVDSNTLGGTSDSGTGPV